MISTNDFLNEIERIASQMPSYRTGGVGKDGTCDCVGLIMGALYDLGVGKWDLHSSNYAARFKVDSIVPLKDPQLGMAVFKAREPYEAGYALPEKYTSGSYYTGDMRDYYHVGVVTRVKPLEITHCTSPDGIKVDTKIGKWKYMANLSETGGEIIMNAIVVSDGNPVKVRSKPSKLAAYIDKLPAGTRVNVVESAGSWSTIEYDGKHGYMLSEFLQSEHTSETEEPNEVLEELRALRVEMESRFDELKENLENLING